MLLGGNPNELHELAPGFTIAIGLLYSQLMVMQTRSCMANTKLVSGLVYAVELIFWARCK